MDVDGVWMGGGHEGIHGRIRITDAGRTAF